MTDQVYKKTELTASSSTGSQDAIANAITRASKSIHSMRWFEVIETPGHIDDDKMGHWQVSVEGEFYAG